MKTITPCLLALVIHLINCPHLVGDIVTWDGGGDGSSWHDRNNWTTDRIPSSVDEVVFSGPADTLVTNDVTISSLSLAAGCTLRVRGSGIRFFVNGPSIIRTANLNIESGAYVHLPGFTSFTNDAAGMGCTWEVTGNSSVLSAPALANIYSPNLLTLRALSGGAIQLGDDSNEEGRFNGCFEFLTDGISSAILVKGRKNLAGSASVTVHGGSHAKFDGFVAFTNNWPGWGSRWELSGTNSILELPNLEQVSAGGHFYLGAYNGAVLSAGIVKLSGSAQLVVTNGAQALLPRLATFENIEPGTGSEWNIIGAGSVLRMPSLTNTYSINLLSVNAISGGTVQLGDDSNDPGMFNGCFKFVTDGTASEIVVKGRKSVAGSASVAVNGGSHAKFDGFVTFTNNWPGWGTSWAVQGMNSLLEFPSLESMVCGGNCNITSVDHASLSIGATLLTGAPAITVRDGGHTAFSNLRSFINDAAGWGCRWQALGIASVLESPELVEVYGLFGVEANGSTSVIDMRKLSIYPSGTAFIEENGGSIILPGSETDQRPTITQQPVDQTKSEGETLLLTAVAAGNAPLAFQWYKDGASLANGGRIAGANTDHLTIVGLMTADSGSYQVLVSNLEGQTNSRTARITVNAPVVVRPQITQPPQSQTNVAGTTASFSVAVSGTPPFSYRWQKNGTALPNATNATLTIANVQPADVGDYVVVVSNSAGSDISAMAHLTVLPVNASQVTRTIITHANGTSADITLAATPASTAAVYAVEETVPANFTVENITESGAFDASTRKVKWGPFFDNTTRSFGYRLVAPSGFSGTATIAGVASFNGVDVPINGQNQYEVTNVVEEPQYQAVMYGGLIIEGTVGATYRIDYASSVDEPVQWTPLQTITLTESPQRWADLASAGQPKRFYKAIKVASPVVNPPITIGGNAHIDTSKSVFGGASLRLNGTTDYLRTPMADGFNFGASDFTIEFWIRFASSTGGNQYIVMVNRASGYDYIVCGRAGEAWYFALKINNDIQVNIQQPDTLFPNTWYHVAFVRQGSSWEVYRDGQRMGTGATCASACPNFVSEVDIGAANGTAFVNGWIDELRISKGIARYTSNFSPPSVPFTNDAFTSLLLHFDGP